MPKTKYEIRDPVHTRITFGEFEREIIDHPYFQRLRFIEQLSFLQSYVYPGGVHSRFSHSLGAMQIAKRLFGRFVVSSNVLTERLTSDQIRDLGRRVRIAGLLHDIGHGPFSHATEAVFPDWQALPLERDWWKEDLERQSVHEDYSVLLIQKMAEEGVFSVDFAQDVASLVHGGVKPSDAFMDEFGSENPSLHRILKAMISGEVDCDRMDYLLRDSYYCGVPYGEYDLDWLISSIGVEENDGRLIFTISENGVRAFEDVLLARYHMIDQVYFHKTKAGFVHYLEQAIITGEIDIDIPTDPKAYVDLRDAKMQELMFEAAKDPSNYWSHHLMNRIPAKRILRLHEQNDEDRQTLDELTKLCETNDVRHFTHSASSELSHYGEGTDAASMVYVAKKVLGGYEYVPIFEYSDLLKKYNEKIHFTDFFVLREDYEKFSRLVE
jgi:hypothetical protein